MRIVQMFRFFILVLLAHFAYCSAAEIKGLDLFGSDDLTIEQIVEAEPPLFESYCEELKSENQKNVDELRQKLSDKLREKFTIAYIRPTAITYFESEGKVIYITFDVVETKDVEKRLNFLEHPNEYFEDPENLLAAWDQYMFTAYELLNAGEIDSQMVKCNAFHYIFGHQHPKLAPFEKLFIEGAAKFKNRLIDIFLRDRNDHQRATAAFLLAYTNDGQELVDLLSRRMRDPSSEVRNNIMRVFACIASDHPEISLPIEEILQALDFPNTTDRNKAAAIIYGLLSQEAFFNDYYKKLLSDSCATLLKMLKLKQPNNSDWAYEILKKISNKKFPKENVCDWEDWVRESI